MALGFYFLLSIGNVSSWNIHLTLFFSLGKCKVTHLEFLWNEKWHRWRNFWHPLSFLIHCLLYNEGTLSLKTECNNTFLLTFVVTLGKFCTCPQKVLQFNTVSIELSVIPFFHLSADISVSCILSSKALRFWFIKGSKLLSSNRVMDEGNYRALFIDRSQNFCHCF